ncbi:hypothetical protein ACO0OL_000773 [Hanseniaspora opuntiae]
MSSNKLSLEERLKLATQSGGKKKGKNKKNSESRNITPSETATPVLEIKQEVVEPSDDRETSQVVHEGFDQEALKELVVEEEETIEFPQGETNNQEIDEKTIESPPVMTSNEQSFSNKPEANTILDTAPLILSTDFLKHFNLSTSYYNNISDQQVINSLETSILDNFNKLHEENTSELQKFNKREAKLTAQISALQKDKVKADLKIENGNKELEAIKKKLATTSTELENVKPKLDEVNKEFVTVNTKLADVERSLNEKDNTIKQLESKLSDTTTVLKNYQLDNDSYANRESELIEEIVTLKGTHEKELSVFESKIEQYKAKIEDMNLKNTATHDGDDLFKNDYLSREIDLLNDRLREQNDTWLNKYQSLSLENNKLKDDFEKIQLDNEQYVWKHLNTNLEKENKELKDSMAKLEREISMKNNQINKLQVDLKLANDLNKVHSKQLQDVIKKNLKQIETRKNSLSPANNPVTDPQDDKDILKAQLRDEWNIQYPDSKLKTSFLMDNESEVESVESTLNLPFKSLETSKLTSKHNDALVSHNNTDIEENDPLSQRKISGSNIPNDNNKINMNTIARLNNKIRSLEYDLELFNHKKEKSAAEKLDQQRQLNEMQKKIDQLITFEQVNSDLMREKARTSERVDGLENALKMKDRRIMELTEDLKDMKELMHHQIQQIMSER